MNDIKITFLDGTIKTFPKGITSLDIAQTVSDTLSKKVLAACINDEIWDATRNIYKDATIQLLTWDDAAGKRIFWHSSAHLLAEALLALYPTIKLGIGPPIEQGFYYDIDFGEHLFDATQLEVVQQKMLFLAHQKNTFQRKELDKKTAEAFFKKNNAFYKLEILSSLQDVPITFYQQGSFIDLCKGPHLPHTGFIKAVKLLNVAGAYWKGNENNTQLTRIYGISFPKEKYLKDHLIFLEEAKKRDHRIIGKKLGLFTFSQKVGIGLPLWLPKGALLRERLINFLSEAQAKSGYQPVVTPHIGKKDLYVTSGHYEKYGAASFQPIHTPHQAETYLLKPMNCPHHCEIYQSAPRSYRDLPLRFSEFGTVYRYEQHGELHGLTRTRGFTQDDAHIFCRPDQVKEEFVKVIDLILYVFKKLGFDTYTIQLSLRDQYQAKNYIGNPDDWDKAEAAIQDAAKEHGLSISTVPGEAAFYGPKLDFIVQDALGRNWQLGTVQLDYQLPERFNLTYIGTDNKKYTPVMIHRAPFGSLERFIAILIEHTQGDFPVWLAPKQVAILPISEKYSEYANKINKILKNNSIYSEIDHRNEKIGKKIRDAIMQKIPYMLIIGEQEQVTDTVMMRTKETTSQQSITTAAFVDLLLRAC